MGQEELNKVSNMLNVKSIEVQNMESRLTGGDLHLNQKVDNETENDLMSLLADDRQNPEESFEDFNDKKVFVSVPGAKLRNCTYGDKCRGAHSEEEIKLLPHIKDFNNLDKSKLELVPIYKNIIQVMESSRGLVKNELFLNKLEKFSFKYITDSESISTTFKSKFLLINWDVNFPVPGPTSRT